MLGFFFIFKYEVYLFVTWKRQIKMKLTSRYMKNYKWVFLMFKTIHRFIIKKEKKKKFLVQYNCTCKIIFNLNTKVRLDL